MSSHIVYFTGSGNSLALSRSIAKRLGGANTEICAIAGHPERAQGLDIVA
jgi:hypothetical protein